MEIFTIIVLSAAMFGIGVLFGSETSVNKPKTRKVKSLEEFTDKELFSLHVAVFNEISRRGAALIDPFEELKKK
jgi:hypothetical protein